MAMAPVLLDDFSSDNLAVELQLRLLNAWDIGDPSRPANVYGFGTHWVDAQGTSIQGESHKNFASVLRSRISVGSVYKLTGFGLRTPRRNFRTSSFRYCLDLTPTTQFQLQPPTTPPFLADSLQYIEFEALSGRFHPPFSYLADIVGKVVAGGEPDHYQRGSSITQLQKLTIANERGVEVVVSLWVNLAEIVDAATLRLNDDANPTIIAFAAFRISPSRGGVTANSCSASRICLHQSDSRSDQLRAFITAAPRTVTYVPPKFATPEQLQCHLRDSYRTVHELLALFTSGADPEPHYRCTAVIKGFEGNTPWSYQACPHCFKAVAPNRDSFWCSVHDSIPAADVQHKYRLKLIVSDSTADATFVLLGMTAERILPIFAAELVRAYPNDYGIFPPTIEFLIGQSVQFEVQMPKFSHSHPFGDIQIRNISGLVIPRQMLVPPVATPMVTPSSPPSTHTTPMPGDPEYVAPVPTYTPPPTSPSHTSQELPSIVGLPQEDKKSSSSRKAKGSPSFEKTHAKMTSTPKKTPPAKPTTNAKRTTTAAKQPQSPQPASPSLSEDDQPLSKVFLTKRSPSTSHASQLPLPDPSAAGSPVTPAFTPPSQEQVLERARSIMQDGSDYMKKSTAILSTLRAPSLVGLDTSSTDISSKSKLPLPLAKVKLEKLQASSGTVPITPQPVLGDGVQPQLGRGMRSQTRKRLFDE